MKDLEKIYSDWCENDESVAPDKVIKAWNLQKRGTFNGFK